MFLADGFSAGGAIDESADIFVGDPLSQFTAGLASSFNLSASKPSELALAEQIDYLLKKTSLSSAFEQAESLISVDSVSGQPDVRSQSIQIIGNKRDLIVGENTDGFEDDLIAPSQRQIREFTSIAAAQENYLKASQSDFIPNEQQIAGEAYIVDPEFDQLGNRVTWQDQENNLWVAPIETDTGLFDLSQARLIDTGLVPIASYRDRTGTGNGPEWIYEQGEAQIVYTKAVGGKPRLARTQGDGLDLTTELLSGLARAQTGVAPIGSLDATDTESRLVYLLPTPPETSAIAWRDFDNPQGNVIDKDVSSAGRWVNNENDAITFTKFIDGVSQVFLYEVETDQLTQLTDGNIQKDDPFIWKAPELNNESLMLVRESDNRSLTSKTPRLGIYRQIDGEWTKITTLQPPSDFSLVRSAEPFVYEGKSYVSFLTEDRKGVPSEVWIASPDLETPNPEPSDPSANFYRQVSDPSVSLVRNDPEVFITEAGAFVYYTARGTGDIYRADTGL